MADSEGNEICVACIWTPALYDQVLYLTPEPLRGPCTLKIAYDETNKAWLDKKPPRKTRRIRVPLSDLVDLDEGNLLSIKSARFTKQHWKTVRKNCDTGTHFFLLLYMPANFLCAFNTKKNMTCVDTGGGAATASEHDDDSDYMPSDVEEEQPPKKKPAAKSSKPRKKDKKAPAAPSRSKCVLSPPRQSKPSTQTRPPAWNLSNIIPYNVSPGGGWWFLLPKSQGIGQTRATPLSPVPGTHCQ